MNRSGSLLVGLLVLGLFAEGCEGKKDVAPAKVDAPKSAPTAPTKAAAPAEADDGAPPQPESKAPEAGNAAAAGPSDSADDGKAGDPLGQRFLDPPWFRRDMLPNAKAVKVSRSEANEQGLFSSQILLELPEGTTTEDCADQLAEKVSTTVPNIERTTESDGRVKLTGSTDRYRVTMMCGDAKGTMRAFVSFEWTS